jgi:integrase
MDERVMPPLARSIVHKGRREAERLNVLQIRRLVKDKERGRWNDGKSLSLVSRDGYNYRWEHQPIWKGKRLYFPYGSYPETSLAEARERAASDRKALREGKDPKAERKATATASAPQITLLEAYTRWMHWKSPTWRPNSLSSAQVQLKKLEKSPIGKKPVADLVTADAYALLVPYKMKAERGNVCGRFMRTIAFAVGHGWRDRDLLNPFTWESNLDIMFPQGQDPPTHHHPAMPFQDLPAYMVELRAMHVIRARALEILTLSASRVSTVCKATWDEIDLVNLVWTRPPDHMKSAREHRVPITPTMEQILRNLFERRTNEFVFPSYYSWHQRPVSRNAVKYLVAPKPYTAHGMRTSFRSWIQDETEFSEQAAEIQLDHVLRSAMDETRCADPTERAYARSDMFEKRRRMMLAWDAYLAGTGALSSNHGRGCSQNEDA